MKDDMNEKKIKNEDLESVSGGYIFDVTELYGGLRCLQKKWEVIDDNTGEVRGSYSSQLKAMNKAEELGLSKYQIFWEDVKKIRGKIDPDYEG